MSTAQCIRQPFCMADFGKENPLPDFGNVSYIHSTVTWDDSLNEDDVRYMRYGRVGSILPYMTQDQYTREKKAIEKPVVVIENEHVRAEFLPWMGARLWSLRVDGREVLNHNPVVQPCNLALRNAWCSGGVEWNIGIRGHNMHTCDDVYAELLSLPDGTAGARFYAFERIRNVAYRLEAYLPPESRLLYVQIHIENPQDNGEVPMYWWSNIAVPEREGTRVIAPAQSAIYSLYEAGQYLMLRRPVPEFDGMDASRPTEITRSIDVFYDIMDKERPFITALQPDHKGLVQASTGFLSGRKLFVWGMGQGGRHWQEFLSDGSESYIEIQAGIAKTQQDHLPMPAGDCWNWLEVYGQLECNVDGLSYDEAVGAARSALDRIIAPGELERELQTRGKQVAASQGILVHHGNGWGSLENVRREKAGLPPLSAVCRFPSEDIRAQQRPWLALLETGIFPESDACKAPDGYLVSAPWRQMLEKQAQLHWLIAYHLGVMHYVSGDPDAARRAMEQSLALKENAWAHRALGRFAGMDGDVKEQLRQYQAAIALEKDRCLCQEYAQALESAGEHELLATWIDQLPEDIRQLPRFQYLRASAAIELCDFALAEKILLRPLVIPDMREGELSLCSLWFTLYERKYGLTRQEAEEQFPLPSALDFRMH